MFFFLEGFYSDGHIRRRNLMLEIIRIFTEKKDLIELMVWGNTHVSWFVWKIEY